MSQDKRNGADAAAADDSMEEDIIIEEADDEQVEYEEEETIVLIDFPEKGPQPWGANADISLIDFASARPRMRIGKDVYQGTLDQDTLGTALLLSRDMVHENGKEHATGMLQPEGFSDHRISFRKVKQHRGPLAYNYDKTTKATGSSGHHTTKTGSLPSSQNDSQP
jgi:TFIIIC subunit triple barrel domain